MLHRVLRRCKCVSDFPPLISRAHHATNTRCGEDRWMQSISSVTESIVVTTKLLFLGFRQTPTLQALSPELAAAACSSGSSSMQQGQQQHQRKQQQQQRQHYLQQHKTDCNAIQHHNQHQNSCRGSSINTAAAAIRRCAKDVDFLQSTFQNKILLLSSKYNDGANQKMT